MTDKPDFQNKEFFYHCISFKVLNSIIIITYPISSFFFALFLIFNKMNFYLKQMLLYTNLLFELLQILQQLNLSVVHHNQIYF